MMNDLLLMATSGINITGDIHTLAELAATPGGLGILSLFVLCVVLVTVFIGVWICVKAILKQFSQFAEGYSRLSISIDNLADSQQDLKEYLQQTTASIKEELNRHREKLDKHTILISNLEKERAHK
jgi:predicted PurR-regulated permease PerM